MKDQLKFIDDQQLTARVIVERGHDEFNRPFIKTAWVKIDTDVDLGSIKEPKNTEILEFKWVDKNPMERMFKGFKGFFGG